MKTLLMITVFLFSSLAFGEEVNPSDPLSMCKRVKFNIEECRARSVELKGLIESMASSASDTYDPNEKKLPDEVQNKGLVSSTEINSVSDVVPSHNNTTIEAIRSLASLLDFEMNSGEEEVEDSFNSGPVANHTTDADRMQNAPQQSFIILC